MNVLGVSRILNEAGGTEWGGVSGIEPYVPKGHVRHYEGELQRKFKVVTPHKIDPRQACYAPGLDFMGGLVMIRTIHDRPRPRDLFASGNTYTLTAWLGYQRRNLSISPLCTSIRYYLTHVSQSVAVS